ncbi:MAG TPA: hypothetical protein VMV69_04840 [Pirellulales bacterium]|nr:hypothetical protein [Pirellulales bacterium]
MATLNSAVDTKADNCKMENDLPAVACHAAVELDNLVLDRPGGFVSVARLISLISESIPQEHDPASPNWLRDPTAVVVVNRALGDATPPKSISTVDELVKEAGSLVQRFSELVRNPTKFRQSNTNELNEMRAFCLALSRRASATKRSPHDRIPEHRFRR